MNSRNTNNISQVLTFAFTVTVLLSLVGCKTVDNQNKNVMKQPIFEAIVDNFGAVGNGKTDDTQAFQNLIDQHQSIKLVLSYGKKYVLKDLYIADKKRIIFDGNGAKITIAANDQANNLIFIEACEYIKLNDLEIDGNSDLNSTVSDFALRINAPNHNTKNVILDNVVIRKTSYGGVTIHNISKTARYQRDFSSGVEKITINKCKFVDFGTRMALQVRGSHKYVEMTNCFAANYEPIRSGAIIGFSAEVSIPHDMMEKVIVKNLRIEEATSKALFFQQIKEVYVDGFHCLRAGVHNVKDLKNMENLTIVKLDDLGFGSHAILKNFVMEETAKDLKGSAFLAIEQTQNSKFGHTSNVILDGFKTDKRIRLAASGRNILKNGVFTDEWLTVVSKNNQIQNVQFLGKQSNIRIQRDSNLVRDCSFQHKGISFFRNVNSSQIVDCELLDGSKSRCLVVIETHKQGEYTKIKMEKCKVPQNSYLVRVAGGPNNSEGVIIETDKKKEELKLHPHIKARGTFVDIDKN